ncbi:MAG: hypothetical protein LBH17_06850 [Oscillospiraceae bacterium]|jgi:hypothetical protein|nr:hypothetical protein [Oscillospiraceae bacterium]
MDKLSPEESLYDFNFDGKLDSMERDEMWSDWTDSDPLGSYDNDDDDDDFDDDDDDDDDDFFDDDIF